VGVEAGEGTGRGRRSEGVGMARGVVLVLAWFKREIKDDDDVDELGGDVLWWAVSPPEVSGAGFPSLCFRG
jgi:hypothetical protein